jgi:type I restriction enzyme S subunit
MEVKPGNEQFEVGVIPEDWTVQLLDNCVRADAPICYGILMPGEHFPRGVPVVKVRDILDGVILESNLLLTHPAIDAAYKRSRLAGGDVLITIRGTTGRVALVSPGLAGANITQDTARLRIKAGISNIYVYYALQSECCQKQITLQTIGQAVKGINIRDVKELEIALPSQIPEQRAIAAALSDVDELLGGLDRLIAKKRDLKQAAMQQLLTGQTRLPGFKGEWEVKSLSQAVDCLDNLRVPLNESQRARMKGDIPYCGANGVLDYVNSYLIDDDIILMAEDGGYFDEYETRPIAYRMSGKCWVNNHAHILKSKADFDQGFLFYSLVHKNILPFLASGTRAKLNKSELFKIEVYCPNSKTEQASIAEVLSDMDAEITALEQRREKTKAIKQAMMQELLTGRIRLV